MSTTFENDGFAKFLFEYIEILNDSNIVNVKMSESSMFILSQFFKFDRLSVYNIQKLLKETHYGSDYGNLHNKIKEFESLTLIRKSAPEHYSGRKAIYYTLTSVGIFYLLCNYSINNLRLYYRNILLYIVEDSFFFYLFLSRIIERNTLSQLSDSHIQLIFLSHVIKILKLLKKEVVIFNELVTTKTGNYAEKYCKWSDLLCYNNSKQKATESSNRIINYWYPQIINSTDHSEFIFSFKDGINHGIRMRNRKNLTDKTIKFSIGRDEYIFEINEITKRTVLLHNNTEIGTNNIQKTLNDYELYKIKYPDTFSYKNSIGSEFSAHLNHLNLDLALKILSLYDQVYSSKAKIYAKEGGYYQDLDVISKDDKIRKFITAFQGHIGVYLANFSSYENGLKQ